jgi:hypothetical protein
MTRIISFLCWQRLRSKGIGVIGLADGSNELILPDVSNNQIHGGYYGIELSGTRLANVVGNELNNNIQAGIQANTMRFYLAGSTITLFEQRRVGLSLLLYLAKPLVTASVL